MQRRASPRGVNSRNDTSRVRDEWEKALVYKYSLAVRIRMELKSVFLRVTRCSVRPPLWMLHSELSVAHLQLRSKKCTRRSYWKKRLVRLILKLALSLPLSFYSHL